jgi:2,4-dienoyl-CoA reductase-like NADH-dependent reductase (Old Yellow Enzyme family)
MSIDSLFQPWSYKGLKLKNRVVMAPMTRSFSPNGYVGDGVADYYARRAAAEVALIVTEGTPPGRLAAHNDPNVPRFYGPYLEGWKPVVSSVHAAGGLIAPQLWHVGAVPGQSYAPEGGYESPSGYVAADTKAFEPMSEEDVADAIAAFARASADAKALGFDCVEIHGAHGYLIDQFFWEATNRREDAYGSDKLPGRARFAADILKATREAVGPDYPIIIRLSQWKQQDFTVQLAPTPKDLEAWLLPLKEAGADIFHCSQRRVWEPEFEGSDLNFAGWAKKITGAPSITVGSVGLNGDFITTFAGGDVAPASIDDVVRRLERGDYDLVAVGRALLQDPNWVRKVREGRHDELMTYDRAALATLS